MFAKSGQRGLHAPQARALRAGETLVGTMSPVQRRLGSGAASSSAAPAPAAQQQRPAATRQQQQRRWQQQQHRARRRVAVAVVASAEPMQVAWVGPDEAPRAAGAAASASRKVVAVVDHTTASVRAVSWCLDNIMRDGDVLHLLHVVPPAAAMANGLAPHASSFEDSDEEQGADLLQRTRDGIDRAFVKKCRAAGARVEVEVVVQGRCNQDASDVIISKVEELGAAVVVMPEARQTLFESLFFQTPVAQQVAQRCKRPTVLIR